jgi:hypothetical protein
MQTGTKDLRVVFGYALGRDFELVLHAEDVASLSLGMWLRFAKELYKPSTRTVHISVGTSGGKLTLGRISPGEGVPVSVASGSYTES